MRVVADTNVVISALLWGKTLEPFFALVNTRRPLFARLRVIPDNKHRMGHPCGADSPVLGRGNSPEVNPPI